MADTSLGTGNMKVNKTFPTPNITASIPKVIEIGIMHKKKKKKPNSFSSINFISPISPMFFAEEHEMLYYSKWMPRLRKLTISPHILG